MRKKAALERQLELLDQGSDGSVSDEKYVLELPSYPALIPDFDVHVKFEVVYKDDEVTRVKVTRIQGPKF